jgi:hypothetical protein
MLFFFRKQLDFAAFSNDVINKCCLLQLCFGPELSNMRKKRYTFWIFERSWLHKSSCYVLRNFCSFSAWTECVPREDFCCLSPPVLSFHKIAATRDSVVKKPQEEYTRKIMLLAELTVETQQSSITQSDAGGTSWPLPASEEVLYACVSNLSEDNGLSCF